MFRQTVKPIVKQLVMILIQDPDLLLCQSHTRCFEHALDRMHHAGRVDRRSKGTIV